MQYNKTIGLSPSCPFYIQLRMKNEKLIEQCNSKRSKIYYRLNQLEDITGLSPRMLKYKMKHIKSKYENVPSLLRKNGKSWKIHISIVNEFMPIRKRQSCTESNYQWSTYVTWNPKENYTPEYHTQLVKEIKGELISYLIKYAIEADKRGVNHIHFMTDATVSETQRAVELVLSKYFDEWEVVTKVSPILNKYSSVCYTNKAPIISGVI